MIGSDPGGAGGGSVARPAAADTVVFATASLQESLLAAADAYPATGKARPVLSFAASSSLARQIENGAPASLAGGAGSRCAVGA